LEYSDRLDKGASVDDLITIVDEIVPYNVHHNAEPEACDLLMEVDRLDRIVAHVDEHNYQRICLYLASCASYVTEPEDTTILNVVLEVYRKMNQLPKAMQIALRLNNPDMIKAVFDSAPIKDPKAEEKFNPLRRQLAFMAGRQYVFSLVDIDGEEDRQLVEAITNSNLPKYFQHLQKDIQMNEPKEPEDIYKSHLAEGRQNIHAKVDSARANLASTYVNAFVNAGSGADKLMTVEGTNNWLYKNKDHGMLAAAASIGMLWQWDVGVGLTEIDKYLYSTEENIQAGALLGVGVLHAGIRSEFDPAFGLLSEYVAKDSVTIKTAAALGLGLAYGGSNREEVRETLRAIFDDPSAPMEVLGTNALSLGLICVGTCDPDLTEAFVGVYVEKSETQLKSTWSRFVALGLGLLYLGKKEASELAVEALKAAPGPLGKFAALTVETLAYAGTGNVLKVQKMLHECNEVRFRRCVICIQA
jgi:26S proteasome regulatory subunit N1